MKLQAKYSENVENRIKEALLSDTLDNPLLFSGSRKSYKKENNNDLVDMVEYNEDKSISSDTLKK